MKKESKTHPERKKDNKPFDSFSTTVTKVMGSFYAFDVAVLLIVV